MTSKIVVNNIEADAGVSTVFFNSDIGATDGTLNVDGNLTVDGVITYEDVTNVDSVGVITARAGIHVTGGSVGIGTDSPETKLNVVGSTASASSSGGTLGIRQKGDTNNDGITLTSSHANSARFWKDSDGKLHIYNTGTGINQFVLDNAGRTGIGTDNPARKVEIFDTAATVLQLNSTNSGGTSLRIQNSGTDKMYMGLAGDFIVGQGSNVTDSAVRASGALLFASGGGTERLRIESNGYVKTNSEFWVGGASPVLRWRNSSNEYATARISSGDLYFEVANAERLRITSAGQLELRKDQDGVTGRPDNRIIFKDTDTSVAANQPIGEISWYSTDAGMVNVNSYIRGINEATNGSGALTFGVKASGSSEIEALRITSGGKVGIGTDDPKQFLSVVGRATFDQAGDYYGAWINGDSGADSSFNVGAWYNVGGRLRDNGNHVVLESMNTSHNVQLQPSGGNVGINETGPDTTLHISKSAAQNDTHGILKVESTNTGTGSATNASLIAKNRYGWSQFMQWEEHGLRIGSRSTTTGGEGKVTVTYGADSTGAVINENGVVTMPQQCGFHVVLHTSQTLTNNGTVNQWDTDASDSRSYIKNMTFNAGRFVAPVAGLYYFTAQLLLSGVASSDDSIHIAWTTGSGNDTFAYWNTRHDGASANGSYGYGGYLPVCGSTTVYLAANAIFGIRANFTGGIGIHGTDANWGHWSGFLVG